MSIHVNNGYQRDEKAKKFGESEKHLLLQLVEPHAAVIKDMRKDSAIIKRKNEVWQEITTSYNANDTISCVRTADQLRKSWHNICDKAKKESSELKQSQVKREIFKLMITMIIGTHMCSDNHCNQHYFLFAWVLNALFF